MAHKKGGGSTRNGRDSNAQRLGVKKFGGDAGARGQHPRAPARYYSRFHPGENVGQAARTTRSSR